MTEEYKSIKFPEDESVHKHVIEWWYFNGHLKDATGNRYAFMNCLFRADVKKVDIPFLRKIPIKIIYFYHAIISDIRNKKAYPSVDDISIVSDDSFSKPLLFVNHVKPMVLTGYTNRVIVQLDEVTYKLKDESVDLIMTAQKRPLLEGGNGYIDVHSKKSYYYSLTNLKTVGRIKIKNKWIEVSGKSWMDHQWANTKYSKDIWTWFSIQLEDERELICYEYDDGRVKTTLASIMDATGKDEHFSKVELVPSENTWTSPKTKAVYPLNWRIKIAERNIDLAVEPYIKEQEVVFGSINYWEGPLKVTGSFNGQSVTGDGFMELVGRPSKYGNIKYAQDRLMKTASDIIAFTRSNIRKKYENKKSQKLICDFYDR